MKHNNILLRTKRNKNLSFHIPGSYPTKKDEEKYPFLNPCSHWHMNLIKFKLKIISVKKKDQWAIEKCCATSQMFYGCSKSAKNDLTPDS